MRTPQEAVVRTRIPGSPGIHRSEEVEVVPGAIAMRLPIAPNGGSVERELHPQRGRIWPSPLSATVAVSLAIHVAILYAPDTLMTSPPAQRSETSPAALTALLALSQPRVEPVHETATVAEQPAALIRQVEPAPPRRHDSPPRAAAAEQPGALIRHVERAPLRRHYSPPGARTSATAREASSASVDLFAPIAGDPRPSERFASDESSAPSASTPAFAAADEGKIDAADRAAAVAPLAMSRSAALPAVASFAPPPAASQFAGPPTVSRSSAPVAYRDNPPPRYPESARADGHQGLVVLRVLVSPEGRAIQITIRTSSQTRALDHAAVESVKGWLFVPAQTYETRVAAWIDVPIRFRLDANTD